MNTDMKYSIVVPLYNEAASVAPLYVRLTQVMAGVDEPYEIVLIDDGSTDHTLKELYENNPRTIRKLWKDPICDCSDWYLLILNSPDANPVGGMGVPAALAPPGRLRTPTPTPTPAGSFGTPQAAGPIVGVRSKVHKEALTAWRGQTYYDQWRFIVGDADREGTGAFDPNSLRRPPGQPPAPTPGR